MISQYAGEVHSFFSNDCYQEIVPEGISKGFAVRWFCDYLGIPIENSVAAGDAQNDVEMLKAAMWELSNVSMLSGNCGIWKLCDGTR